MSKIHARTSISARRIKQLQEVRGRWENGRQAKTSDSFTCFINFPGRLESKQPSFSIRTQISLKVREILTFTFRHPKMHKITTRMGAFPRGAHVLGTT